MIANNHMNKIIANINSSTTRAEAANISGSIIPIVRVIQWYYGVQRKEA